MPTRHRYTRSSIEAQSILLRVRPLIASRLVVSPMSLERRAILRRTPDPLQSGAGIDVETDVDAVAAGPPHFSAQARSAGLIRRPSDAYDADTFSTDRAH